MNPDAFTYKNTVMGEQLSKALRLSTDHHCAGKVSYVSIDEARTALSHLLARDDVQDGHLLSIYWCRNCPRLHIGRSRPGQDEPRRVTISAGGRDEQQEQ